MIKNQLKATPKGSVLTEFLVVAGFVLVPMAIGLILLTKYTETKHRHEMATRYAGWERTVWYENMSKSLKEAAKKTGQNINTVKSSGQIGIEIQNRVFSDKNTPIYKAQDVKTTKNSPDPMLESLWMQSDHKKSTTYKIEKDQFVTSGGGEKKAYGYANKVLKPMMDTLGKFSDFDLNTKGVRTATVGMTLKKPEFFKDYIKKDMVVNKSYTIFTDGWNAAGPKHAELMVSSTVPMEFLDIGFLNKIRDVLAILPIAKELHSSRLKFGHVEVDAVPEVHLEKYKKK